MSLRGAEGDEAIPSMTNDFEFYGIMVLFLRLLRSLTLPRNDDVGVMTQP